MTKIEYTIIVYAVIMAIIFNLIYYNEIVSMIERILNKFKWYKKGGKQ